MSYRSYTSYKSYQPLLRTTGETALTSRSHLALAKEEANLL